MDELSVEQMLEAVAEETPAEAPQEGGEPTQEQGAGAHGQEPTGQVDDNQALEFLDLEKYGNKHVKFKANGQEYSHSLSKVLESIAPRGVDYDRIVNEFKEKEPQYQTEIEKLKQSNEELNRWKQYDEFARQNPQWRQHVEQAWQNRHQHSIDGLEADDPIAKQIAELKQTNEELRSQLGEVTQKFDGIMSDQQARQVDAELDQEIGTVADEFSDVDLDKPMDESGTSIRNATLQHMVDQKIPTFKAAFLDLFHSKVIEAREAALRQKHADELQKRHKQGIIGISSTPNGAAGGQESANVKPANYEHAAELALRELGLN